METIMYYISILTILQGTGPYTVYNNGSFAVFGDESYVPQFADYLRLGNYLNFYSPDISYNQ
jgi:hypothetical protein